MTDEMTRFHEMAVIQHSKTIERLEAALDAERRIVEEHHRCWLIAQGWTPMKANGYGAAFAKREIEGVEQRTDYYAHWFAVVDAVRAGKWFDPSKRYNDLDSVEEMPA